MNNRMEKACYKIMVNAGKASKTGLDKVFQESERSDLTFSQLLVKSGLMKESDMLNI